MPQDGSSTRPRAIFMGTPGFAATILRRLLAPDSPVEVVGVVTQPDRPVGRSQVLVPPPVKALATAHGIPVLQPVTFRRPAAAAALARLQPDIGIVAAYGKILPPAILAIASHGYLNVHASLLPRWRGAWPVGAAILAGDAETGVSIMRLDEGMDTGPVLAIHPEPIFLDDTTASLEARLAMLGANVLVETLPRYIEGLVTPSPQNDHEATYCRPVRKADGLVDWSQPAAAIERQIRAMQPWPVASTTWNSKQLRLLKAHVLEARETLQAGAAGDAELAPGTVIALGKDAGVTTGEDVLALDQVQLEGKGVTLVRSFINGYRSFVGSQLGE